MSVSQLLQSMRSCQMNAPKAKQASITLVGLTRAFDENELMNMLPRNDFIKSFSNKNKLADHIKFHTIKPLRNNPSVFQAFASVSPILRDGIRGRKDKIIIGVTSCKVYDRKQLSDVITASCTVTSPNSVQHQTLQFVANAVNITEQIVAKTKKENALTVFETRTMKQTIQYSITNVLPW